MNIFIALRLCEIVVHATTHTHSFTAYAMHNAAHCTCVRRSPYEYISNSMRKRSRVGHIDYFFQASRIKQQKIHRLAVEQFSVIFWEL